MTVKHLWAENGLLPSHLPGGTSPLTTKQPNEKFPSAAVLRVCHQGEDDTRESKPSSSSAIPFVFLQLISPQGEEGNKAFNV